MSWRAAGALAAMIGLGACGGADQASGTVKGYAASASSSALVEGGNELDRFSIVYLSSLGNICTSGRDHDTLNQSRLVVISLAIVAPGGALAFADQAGTYPIYDGSSAVAAGAKIASARTYAFVMCGPSVDEKALGGTVTIHHAEIRNGVPGRLAGDFRFTFQDGSVSGSFDAAGPCTGFLPYLLICNP